ncbi:MAG: hypothetical protein V4440_14730 [Pseudomonadota bacterium]
MKWKTFIAIIAVIGMAASVISNKIDFAIFCLLSLILGELEDIHDTFKSKLQENDNE